MSTAEIIEMVRELPPEEQREVLRQVADIVAGASEEKPAADGTRGTLGDLLRKIAGRVDDPRVDGAELHDHYLYGSPRRPSAL